VIFRRWLAPKLRPFPPSFFFGVATADHQCEAAGPRQPGGQPWPDDIRDVWERENNLVPRQRATEFWTECIEDVKRAAALGCTAFRFSIAWSRVLPAPESPDEEAFDHYKQLIAAIVAAKMKPVLTLHHYTWPLHVEQRGGMLADDFPDTFKQYATEVVKRLGENVDYWVTFNEPNHLPLGYLKFEWETAFHLPPGLAGTPDEQRARAAKVIRNLFLANAYAYDVIKSAFPQAQVCANPWLMGLPRPLERMLDAHAKAPRGDPGGNASAASLRANPLGDWAGIDVVSFLLFTVLVSVLGDLVIRSLRKIFRPIFLVFQRVQRAVRRAPTADTAVVPAAAPAAPSALPLPQAIWSLLLHPNQYSIMLVLVIGHWWQLGLAGQLSSYLCPPECHGKQDFVGLDYYWGVKWYRMNRLSRLIHSLAGPFDQAPVWTRGLYNALTYHSELFRGKPILVTENGNVDRTDGYTRERYIRDHLAEVQRAVATGVPVVGYLCWSITSNREWGLPFVPGSDFGLYKIELDQDPNLARTPTRAAEVYRTIIAGRTTEGVDPDAVGSAVK